MRAKLCLWTWVFVASTILILEGRVTAQPQIAPPIAPPQAIPSVPPAAPPQMMRRETYRLGCQLRSQPPDGLLVAYVRPRGPATRLVSSNDANVTGRLEIGDVITQVDGNPVVTVRDYQRAMDAAVQRGGRVELMVRDVNGSGEQVWVAQGNREQVVGPPDEVRVRMVHFLFIGTTELTGNDKALGDAIQFNLSSLREMAGTVPEQRVAEIKVIEGSQCTAEDILREVQSLPLSYDDSIFCHYSGHGAYDPAAAGPEDKSNGHHFQIESGALMRYELWQALKKHDVRLTVLMTDTCNPLAKAKLGARRQFTIRADTQPYSNLEQLLLGYRGSIDVSTTEMGQYAWYSINPDSSSDLDRSGGWFTAEVCSVLPRYNDWTTAFSQLRTLTNNDYKERKARLLAGGVDDLTKECTGTNSLI